MKLLLLGTGDSGKTSKMHRFKNHTENKTDIMTLTALRKQMRCLYGEGFPLQTRKQIGPVVIGNLVEGMKDILGALPNLQIELPEELKSHAAIVSEITTYPPELSPELADSLTKLASSAAVKEALSLSKRREFHLQDCWPGFARELLETPGWGREGWVPSIEDCVSVRVRTSGIVEERFVIEKITFNVFDVGGQRAERRKWIHSFDNVTAVLFVTAISEYDQVLFEDKYKNRLEEAIGLFEEICNSRWFSNVPIMLFLNKKDLFEKKFLEQKVPLNISGLFPTAPEQNNDMEAAIGWITEQFVAKRKLVTKDIYTYVTTATDSGNVRAVFDLCRSVILRRNLTQAGFIVTNTEVA